MKKNLLLLMLLAFGYSQAQNPSDIDAGFNAVSIPENRYCLDNTMIAETNSLGQMMVQGPNSLAFIDQDQNLIHHFSIEAQIYGFKFQGDNKVLVLSNGTSVNGVSVPYIFRLDLATGTVDPTFILDPSITYNDVQGSISVWNNKIYVQASSAQINGEFKTIFRLDTNGAVDSSFNYTGDAFHDAYYLPDGTVFLFRTWANPRVIRLDATGSINTEFSEAIYYSKIYSVKPAANGDIYFNCECSVDGTYAESVYKVHPDGTLAEDFNILQDEHIIRSMITQPDYKVVIAGYQGFSEPVLFLKRLLPNGEIDAGFQSSEFELQELGWEGRLTVVKEIPTGKFYFSNNELFRHNGTLVKRIIRFNSDGSRDLTFDRTCKGFTDGEVSTIEEQTDGKLLVAGTFNAYNGFEIRARLVRLHPNGNIDEPFLANLGHFEFEGSMTDKSMAFKAVQVMPDGKILLVGTFNYVDLNGVLSQGALVLNSDGTTFKSFTDQLGGGFHDIQLQSSGKALIFSDTGGNFGATTNANVIRLDANFNYDPTFQHIAIHNNPHAFKVLPDDKVLVSGNFATGSDFRKFSADGVPDNSFLYTYSDEFDIRADGKIITITYSGLNYPQNYQFTRLSSTGILEATLNYTQYFSSPFLIQPDNKIVHLNTSGQLARFTDTGIIDPSFDPKSFGASPWPLQAITLLSDGRIAVGGDSDTYDGQRIGKFTVVNGSSLLAVNDFNSNSSISVFPNPVSDIVKVISADTIRQITLIDLQGRILQSLNINAPSADLDLSSRTSGMYFLKITTDKGEKTTKLVKQ
ncbi:MAG TPA: T9SS type A sorting domain-containing protein [Flavobacterium sp.]